MVTTVLAKAEVEKLSNFRDIVSNVRDKLFLGEKQSEWASFTRHTSIFINLSSPNSVASNSNVPSNK